MATADKIDDIAEWKRFVSERGLRSIDVPYAFSVGALNVAGVFHLRDPLDQSSTEGVVVGVVNGTYRLDRNNGVAELRDPTGQLLRFVIELRFSGQGELRARLDTRRWDGQWNEGSWVIIWRG